MNNNEPGMKAYIGTYNPNHPVGWNDSAAILTYLGVSILTPGYVPKMVFINRHGIIQAQYQGENPFFTNQDANIRAELDKLLAADGKANTGHKKSAGKKGAAKKK